MTKNFEEEQLARSDIKRLDPILNEPVLDHNYDGIEELDNPLPGWWLATFYMTIAFGAVYFYYHNISGGSQRAQVAYQQEVAAYELARFTKEQSEIQALDPDKLNAQIKDASLIQSGAKHFAERCSSCHAADGGGGIGPNLTDAFWLNGDGTPLAIHGVIDKGIPEKGMPPWGSILSDQELVETVAFVTSLQGTPAANPKAAQGKEVK